MNINTLSACSVVLCVQGLIHSKSLTHGDTTLAKFQAVRMIKNGYFCQITGFYKPLFGFKVQNEGTGMAEQDAEETLSLVRNLRYFGHHPGYFTQAETGVVVQLWNPKSGLTFTCIDATDLSATFETDVAADDVSECLGSNAQVFHTHVLIHYL